MSQLGRGIENERKREREEKRKETKKKKERRGREKRKEKKRWFKREWYHRSQGTIGFQTERVIRSIECY